MKLGEEKCTHTHIYIILLVCICICIGLTKIKTFLENKNQVGIMTCVFPLLRNMTWFVSNYMIKMCCYLAIAQAVIVDRFIIIGFSKTQSNKPCIPKNPSS